MTTTPQRPKDQWCCSFLLGGAAFPLSPFLAVLLWVEMLSFEVLLCRAVFPLLLCWGGGASHPFFCGALVGGVALQTLHWEVMLPQPLFLGEGRRVVLLSPLFFWVVLLR